MLTELEQAIKTRASMRVSYSASQGVDVALLVSPCTVEDVTYLLDQLEAEREKVAVLRRMLAAKGRLLTAYRLGSHAMADKALSQIEALEERLKETEC